MSPDSLKRALVRKVPSLRAEDEVGDAVETIIESGLPALPVVDEEDGLYGIFGEREFIGAVFPGYFQQLRSARFVTHSIDDVIQQRLECRHDPVSKYANTEPIAAGADWADAQLAETFLHHRVLVVPIVDEGGRFSVLSLGGSSSRRSAKVDRGLVARAPLPFLPGLRKVVRAGESGGPESVPSPQGPRASA